jgi:hypothetical protein
LRGGGERSALAVRDAGAGCGGKRDPGGEADAGAGPGLRAAFYRSRYFSLSGTPFHSSASGSALMDRLMV